MTKFLPVPLSAALFAALLAGCGAMTPDAPSADATARIAALASGGEVLVSIQTVESAGSRHPVTETRSAELKGLAEPVVIASLVWS